MESIDVSDLPEGVARAIAQTVENLREEFSKCDNGRPKELPVAALGVIGTLSRREIYDYLDEQQ